MNIATAVLFCVPCATPPAVDQGIQPLHVVRMSKADPAPHCCAFFPDGKTIVFGGGNFLGPGELVYWDVKTAKVRVLNTEHKLAIGTVAVSPDGTMVATGGGFGEVKVYDANGKNLANLDGLIEYTASIAFSPDGKWLAHSGGKLAIRDTKTFEMAPGFHQPSRFGQVAGFTSDSKHLLCLRLDEVTFLETAKWTATTHTSDDPHQAYGHRTLSPSDKLMVIGISINNKPNQNNWITDTEVWSVSLPKLDKRLYQIKCKFLGRAFTPDSKYLILGEMDVEHKNRIRIFVAETGKELVSWVAGDVAKCIRCLAVSPDGKLLASCVDGEGGKIWDLEKIIENAKKVPNK